AVDMGPNVAVAEFVHDLDDPRHSHRALTDVDGAQECDSRGGCRRHNAVSVERTPPRAGSTSRSDRVSRSAFFRGTIAREGGARRRWEGERMVSFEQSERNDRRDADELADDE